MNDLDQQLQDLKEDVPPMPEDFHQQWMKKVEDAAMEKPAKRTTWTRILSVAAALVFVVGGTLLTKDELSAPLNTRPKQPAELYESYDTGSGYSMRSVSESSNGLMMAKMTADEAVAFEEGAQEKKIIRSASLTIATPAFEESLNSLRTLCADAGGWVAYSSESDNGERRSATLTLRVPADQLDAFLQGAGSAGRITWRSESADDVTASYQDTAARLATQEALMARLQTLVTDAASLSDLLALEAQMADTQYQIDQLKTSLASTDRQVAYATVDLTLREELPSDSLTEPDLTLLQRLQNAIQTGWNAFTSFLSDATVFLAAALPFLLIVAIVVVIVKIARKRKG